MTNDILCKTSKRRIREAERRAQMLRLRADGFTLAQIGHEMGVCESTVQRVIEAALRSLVKAPAEELRALELARCDELLEEAMAIVRAPMQSATGRPVQDADSGAVVIEVVQDAAPKLAAITTALRVMERRAKLLGLDVATKASSEDLSGLAAPSVHFYIPSNGREAVGALSQERT